MKKHIFSLFLVAFATLYVFPSCSSDDDNGPQPVTSMDNGYISSALLKGTWRTGNESHYKLMIFSHPGTFTLVDYVDGKETGRNDAIYAFDSSDTHLFKFSYGNIVVNDNWSQVQYFIWQNTQHTSFVLSDSSLGTDGTLYVKQ